MDNGRQTVLFVDDDPNILEMLQRMLAQREENLEAHYCLSVEHALAVLDSVNVDAVVSDVRMPVRDGFELLSLLRASERTRQIPVVILTGDGDTKLKRKALDLGATDLLNKPVNREDLLARIRNVLRLKSYEDRLSNQVNILDKMVAERTRQLEAAQKEVVWRLAKACEFRDDETGNHVLRVACYSRLLAETLGQSEEFRNLIYMASPLHDIGKIGIRDSVLLKEGKLTEGERAEMKRHAGMGKEILHGNPLALGAVAAMGMDPSLSHVEFSEHPLLQMAASIAFGHHEKWNGEGYPNGSAGEEIPIEARIVAVADVYDALRSVRPYKPAFPEEKTLEIIQEESGRHFDPLVVEAFLKSMDSVRFLEGQLRAAPGESYEKNPIRG